MKAIFKSSILLLFASVTLWSCKKDETKTILKPGGALTLTSSATTLVLQQANAASTATILTWGKADFGYSAAITYTIQLCKGGTNFASPATTTEIGMGTALTKTFTVAEFNAKMQEIINDGTATPVQARIKASVGANVDPLYSNVVSFTVTSYLDIVSYSFPAALNVAGNYQGWAPGVAPQIVNTRNGGYGGYEGYIVFNDAAPQFKFVKGNDWPAGDFGGGVGTLTNGGSNLTLPSGGAGIAGLYLIRANTNSMTWDFTKINTWGIIGNATPGDWGASTPMTFNPSNGSWSITANLTVGEMKFRANNDWAINFGDNNNPIDNKPEYGGTNIPVTVAGNYTITLNIGIGGNYSYKLKKN
ncbi:MAG: SusE domain-containing protein [Chitinophagaceae bacterium]|nr:SusE domain-containing protein [Chitinophagaceae bacterium]